MALQGKKILLGVCGSIAAYKAALLVRLLIKQGAAVKVIMTKSATDFISPLTLSTLSKNEVITQFYADTTELWNNHVDLGLWADAFVIAPTSGSTLAKLANGMSNNVLVATYLSARCPVFIAPAMDVDMWQHPATQRNIERLRQYGNIIITVGVGELASGLYGAGRLAEPEQIVAVLNEHFVHKVKPISKLFKDIHFLISAGPTYEPIDPVRFIGNRSSGKMGFALAKAALQQGARVTLVMGPNNLNIPVHPRMELVNVQTAQDMYVAITNAFASASITIMAAAVADYTPTHVTEHKIKKKEGDFSILLKRTKDILAHLGNIKSEGQLLVGFALETKNELANAKSKLKRKKLDAIVLNSLKHEGAGFQYDTNKITILDKYNNISNFELKTKDEVALDILQVISTLTDSKI